MLVIAVIRDHHRLPWIGLLNFATGWTIAGWIAALVWSLTAIRQPAIMWIGSTAPRTTQPAAARIPYSWRIGRACLVKGDIWWPQWQRGFRIAGFSG